MRLRKKNVSRVAAVAVAAVMAVSAAAPVAVAAAPAVNGGTAVVQEASQHVIGINYKNSDTGEFIQTGSVKVSNSATQITADMLEDVPANWVVDSVFVPVNINSDTEFVDIYCKPAPTTKFVKINFYSEAEKKQIAEPEIEVAADATSVNSSKLDVPEGYELCVTGDLPISDGYVYAAVRKVATTKFVKINFYSEAEKKQIEERKLPVDADATYVNSSKLTAPKG